MPMEVGRTWTEEGMTWHELTLAQLKDLYGSEEYRKKIKKVKSGLFSYPKNWEDFLLWASDFPPERVFKIMYIEPLNELWIPKQQSFNAEEE